MVREVGISVYLFVFRLLFHFFKLFPLKEKTIFVASFGDNVLYTIEALENLTDQEIIILQSPKCKITFKRSKRRKIIGFENGHPVHWVRSIFHLATSEKVFVDNYYGFLAVTDFRDGVECIQLWHAAGAIKQFGLKDLSIQNRPQRAYKRFKQVYRRFDHVVVGSENMSIIFQEGFGIKENQILRTGIPRTDFFYDSHKMNKAKELLEEDIPVILDKKVILYAPTYRDQELTVHKLALDLEKMYHACHEDYILLLSLHPAVEVDIQNDYHDFVHEVCCYHINELLTITDILITDYSSIPFEFSLLHRPMIFFAYDLEEYAEERGFWENYEELVPGPVVENTDDLVDIINHHEFDMSDVVSFASVWNQYSLGESSRNLISSLYKKEQM